MVLRSNSPRLAHRLIFLMLLATVPAMLARVIVVHAIADKYARVAALDQLSVTASTLAAKIDGWAAAASDDLQLMSGTLDLAAMDAAHQHALFVRVKDHHSQFTLVHTLDLQGIDVARSDGHGPLDYHDRQFCREILAGASFAQEVDVSGITGRPTFTQAVPLIGSDGKLKGILAISMDLAPVNQLLAASGYSQTGYSCLLDQQGHTMTRPTVHVSADQLDLSSLRPAGDTRETDEHGDGRYQDAQGVWWLARAVPLSTGWSVVSLQQDSEALATGHDFVLGMALAIVLVTAAIMSLFIWLTTKWITRPVKEITRIADLIARGDWTQRIPEERTDELGTLARAFNRMVEELARTYHSATERARELLESEQNYRRLIETSHEGVWIVDADERTKFVNAALCDMLGYSAEELLGRHPAAFMPASERSDVLRQIALDHAEGRHESECCFLRKDGGHLWVLISASPIHNHHGSHVGTLGMFTDITKRRRSEHLQAGQSRVLQLLATGRPLEEVLSALILVIEERLPGMSGSVLLLDPDGQRLRFAAAPSLPASYTQAARSIAVGPHSGSCGAAAARGERVITEDIESDPLWVDRRLSTLQHGFRSCWSQPIWSRTHKILGTFALYCRQGHKPGAEELRLVENAARLAGVAIERRQEEQARNELQRSTEEALALLDTLQTHAPVGFGFIDRQFRFARINETLAAMNDSSPSATLGHTVAEIAPDLWPQAEPLFSRVLAGESVIDVEFSGKTLSRPNEHRHWLVSYYPVRISGEIIAGIGIVCIEITERKRAQAAAHDRELAAHRDAVRAMENVLGIVGHELRTPLAGMRAISEFLITDKPPGNLEDQDFLRQLNAETIRMSDTVNDLLEAARLNSGQAVWRWTRVDLDAVCREAIDTIRPLVDTDRVELAVQVDPPGISMLGDADSIRRLVINLLSNARKHTTDGRIAIHVSLHRVAEQAWAHVEVRDTGEGIPSTIVDRLGEAFALNAGVVGANHVEGTGLGLAICKGIAAAHGGSLTVASSLGVGACVTAKFRADLAAPATGSATIQLIKERGSREFDVATV